MLLASRLPALSPRGHRGGSAVRRVVVVASSGAADADPYALLGVTPLTSAEELSRARTRLVKAARSEAAAEAAEAAYTSIMMSQLKRRMKGEGAFGMSISKDVATADVESWLPRWRPRKAFSSGGDIALNAALALFLSGYTLAQPLPGVLPLTVAMVIFFFRVNQKLVLLLPSPEGETKNVFEGKRMLRVIGLVLGAIAAAIVVVTYLPTAVAQVTHSSLPSWVITKAEHGVNIAACIALFIVASFYR